MRTRGHEQSLCAGWNIKPSRTHTYVEPTGRLRMVNSRGLQKLLLRRETIRKESANMVEPNTRGRPRSGGALKRVATRFGAMLGVAAVAATGLLTLAPGDAEAASGPWKNGAGYGYAYNPHGNNWEMGGSWAGNFIAGDGSKWACAVDDEGWRPTTNMGSPNYPDATVRTSWEGNALRLDGGYNRNTISGNKLAQAAYVNSHLLDSTSNTTAAAAKIAQYKIFGVYSGSLAETHTTNRLPNGVFSR